VEWCREGGLINPTDNNTKCLGWGRGSKRVQKGEDRSGGPSQVKEKKDGEEDPE